jgi:hypothetical protein
MNPSEPSGSSSHGGAITGFVKKKIVIEAAAGVPRRGLPKAVEKIFVRKSWTAAVPIITGGMGASAPIKKWRFKWID